jgi:predicted nucleic acid-binding protein
VELTSAIGAGPVALESTIFIYLIEQHPKYLSILKPVFERIDRGDLTAVTSSLTLLETLIVPYRNGDRELAQKYEDILTNGRGLTVISIDLPVIRLAAEIRAATSMRTPDALQLAAALTGKCTAFLTNDRRLPELHSIRILRLDAFDAR